MKELSANKLMSIINTQSMKDAYYRIPIQDWDLSDTEIVNALKPTKMDWKLRIRFWDLVDKATDKNNGYDMIYAVDVQNDICDAVHLRRRFQKRYFPSFFFRPVEKYLQDANAMLVVSSNKMWDLINGIEPFNKDGTLNIAAAQLLKGIHNDLVNRKMGAVKQLVEMKKIQLNINGLGTTDDIEMLDAQINEMKPNVDISERERFITSKEETL